MGNKENYLARLQLAIEHAHQCRATWRYSEPVQEVFRGKTVWQGDVEVFDLGGHPEAKRCFAWSHNQGRDDKSERFVALLGIAPIESASTAVRVQIIKDVRSGYFK